MESLETITFRCCLQEPLNSYCIIHKAKATTSSYINNKIPYIRLLEVTQLPCFIGYGINVQESNM